MAFPISIFIDFSSQEYVRSFLTKIVLIIIKSFIDPSLNDVVFLD